MPPINTKSIISQALRKWYAALAVALVLVVWGLLALAMLPSKDSAGSYATRPYGLTTGLENYALDQLFQLRDALHPDQRQRGLNEPITIIGIDEKSIKDSNIRLQKWPRNWYAHLIDRASTGGAGVIGVDAFLSEAGGLSADDKAFDTQLAETISNAGNVVLASKLEAGGYQEIAPLPMFTEGAYATGFADMIVDSDGFVRSSQLVKYIGETKQTEFSFAVRLAEGYSAAMGKEDQVLKPTPDTKGFMFGDRVLQLRTDTALQLDFRGRSPAFRYVAAGDILCAAGDIPCETKPNLPDDLFRDRIVLIGASNIDAPDLFATPFYEPSILARTFDWQLPLVPSRMPGVEIHANSIGTILFGSSPARPRYLWQTLSLIVPLVLVALAVFLLRAFWGLSAVIAAAVGSLIVASWAFNAHGLILPLADAWLGMVVLAPLGLSMRYARERALRDEKEAERAQIMDIFARCVSPEVADTLWERRERSIFEGERRVVTIIFTDIRSFTTLSEKQSSEVVVKWLNDYFGRMAVIIKEHCGHINKFIGDGLMIVFGAPIARGDEEEARAAVACGLEMLEAVERMTAEWQAQDAALPESERRPVVKIGVGIHSGIATCGVVGAEQRLEYTVIGDTVNLSARLESETKSFGVPILISDATANLIGDKYQTRALGEVKVKGKTSATKVFTVETNAPAAVAEASAETVSLAASH
ncbi:MAG: CHASE2 domain-containing protein [Pyrinomonadaceae bacterium]